MDEETAAQFKALLESNPRELIKQGRNFMFTDAKAAVLVGRAYLRLREYGNAEAVFQGAMQLDPNYAAAIWYAGVAAERQGRVEDAKNTYRHVLEVDPDFPAALAKLGLSDQSAPADPRTFRSERASAGSSHSGADIPSSPVVPPPPNRTEPPAPKEGAKRPAESQLWLPTAEEVPVYYGRLRDAKEAEWKATAYGVPRWYKALFSILAICVLVGMISVGVIGYRMLSGASLERCQFMAENFPDDLSEDCQQRLGRQP